MDSNVKYKDKTYWDSRYSNEECYEWFKDYSAFRALIQKYVQPSDKILMLGCGNSRLSTDMYMDGFRNIVNVDYSQVCITNMQKRHKELPDMVWKVMDIHNLEFDDGEFDVILEKGTLDALLVAEEDRWHLSDAAFRDMENILLKCSRILKPNGKFLSITFEQPFFRKRIYARTCLDWNVVYHAIGEQGCLEYFMYCMVKGKPLSKVDKKFETHVSKQREERWTEPTLLPCTIAENDICNIEVEMLS